jgi:hypothetical protein
MDKEEKVREGKNNKRKGQWYERLVCKIINDYMGTGFIRTPKSGGGPIWKGDLMNRGKKSIMDSIHFECKNQKNFHIQTWLKQAYFDAPKRTVPIVVAKSFRLFNTVYEYNKKIQHVVSLDLMDFLMLLKMIDDKEVSNDEEEITEDVSSIPVPEDEEQYAEARAELARKLSERYQQEDRERKKRYADASKKTRERARQVQKDRVKNFKEDKCQK